MAENYLIKNKEDQKRLTEKAIADPEGFWEEYARTSFTWRKPWHSVLEWDFHKPEIKWFDGAQLNITENCLDRHLEERGDQTAIIWEPNDTKEDSIHLTYRELYDEVNRFAHVLRERGVSKGDRVCIYMPMVVELAVAVLACARIGAVHSVVFAGFSSKSLEGRINDAQCSMVLTSDGGYRGSKTIDLKSIVDEALEECTSVREVIVLKRTGAEINMVAGRDVWWHDLLEQTPKGTLAEPEVMEAEDMLFILYTSGSTGKPKGMVHTCAGYMVYAQYSFLNVFQYQEDDIYWCTADIGWITGHTYIVYGPLLAGATTMMFEGVPSYPDMGRFWDVVDEHKVNIFYTAPTAIRALAAAGPEYVDGHDLSSLRILGSVGEPINLEAWNWYNEHIGKGKCPIVDTWWQTETGGIMISPIPGGTDFIPTYAMQPLPGVRPALMDDNGNVIHETEAEGRLCISHPWPSIARTIYGDHKRYKDTYFSTFPGNYFSGDGCKRDANGNYKITGRVDDIVIVSGHNLGTAEIENAIDEHALVSESAVVGYPHDIKGNAIYAYVTCVEGAEVDNEKLKKEILEMVSHEVGPIAKPDKILICRDLPKTRSGKIMRRILRKIASDDVSNLGDISTLLNPEVVKEIAHNAGVILPSSI